MNSPGFWEITMKWIAENTPAIYAGLSAVGVSALMSIRDGKPKKYTVTTAAVCGIIGMSLSGLMEHFGLPSNAASLVGGFVGFIGADTLRDLATTIVNRRVSGNQQGDKK